MTGNDNVKAGMLREPARKRLGNAAEGTRR